MPAPRSTRTTFAILARSKKERRPWQAARAATAFHNILPSSDPRSMTYPKNLPSTCGKCHPGAGTRFALGPIHESAGAREPHAGSFVRIFYLLVVPGAIGLMLLHNAGDWVP